MAVDLSVFGNIKTKADYDRANEEFQLKKQLAQAEIKKATMLDADKLGEQAFMKAAQGIALTPQELAAAQLVDAKSGGVSFNPVDGTMIQKPRISDKIGLPGLNNAPDTIGQSVQGFGGEPDFSGGNPGMNLPGGMGAGLGDMGTNSIVPLADKSVADAAPTSDFYQQQYERAMAAAEGNPRLQQTISTDYQKSKLNFTEGQSNAAGFADRIAQASPLIDQYAKASMDPVQRTLDAVPLVGNYLVNDDYQSADQAKRNFINAQLRRESGAVISPGEFKNADLQYFPVPGDSEQVLAQKAANRQAALESMQRSAGPAYAPPAKPVVTPQAAPSTQAPSKPKMGTVEDGYVFMGGDPANPKNWKKK